MDDSALKNRFGPRAMQFLRHRSRTSEAAAMYPCPDSCERPCCTNQNTQANVTIFDILLMAAFRHEDPLEFFKSHVELGASVHRSDIDNVDLRLWEVVWRLPRPCPLLESGRRCSVHPVKPQGCRVFPESAHLFQLRFPGSNPQNIFGDPEDLQTYPCFQEPVDTGYLAGLEHPLENQILRTKVEHTLSKLLLFRRAPLLIDITPNLDEIAALDSRTGPGVSMISEQAVLRVLRRHEQTFRQMAEAALTICRDRAAFERVLDAMEGWADVINHHPIAPDHIWILDGLDLGTAPARPR